jgi:hypothetical protein
MSTAKIRKSKSPKSPEIQNPTTATPRPESRSSKKPSTRPGKKVISLIVDEKWAAKVSLCARAEGVNQTEFIVATVSRGLKGRLDAALAALKAEVD